MSEFHERLRKVRQYRAYSQKCMAQLLEITESGYAHWEQGRTEPNIQALRTICQILKVNSDYLIGIENEINNTGEPYCADNTPRSTSSKTYSTEINCIAKRIQFLRTLKNESQQQLAIAIGVAQSAISQWENEINEPKATYILRL